MEARESADAEGRRERWRALRAALDRAAGSSLEGGDGSPPEDTETVERPESERLDLDLDATDRPERTDDTAALGAPSARVLTVDEADEAFDDRDRDHGPTLSIENPGADGPRD